MLSAHNSCIVLTAAHSAQAPAVSGLEMPSAEELARYILTTGDQQTVVTLIEAMVEGGEVSRHDMT